MANFIVRNGFLLAMAALEFGQAAVDLWHGNYPRAAIMACAGTSSIAFIWVV